MQDNKLHIVIVASWYPSDDQPFYGIFVEEQALLLRKNGHRIVVFYPYLNGDFKAFLKGDRKKSKKYLRNGIKVIEIPQNIYLPKAKDFFIASLISKTIKTFKDYIDKEGLPDVIHSHSAFMGGVVGLELNKKFKIPLVHTEHSSGFIFNKSQYTKIDLKRVANLYNHSSRFVFVSEYFKNAFETSMNLSGQGTIVIPNMVSDDFFNQLKPLKTEHLRALSVGSLISVKNHLLLLKAWKIVIKKFPKAKLSIAGNGYLAKELKEFSVTEKISETLEWHDGLKKEKLIEMIDLSNVIVSTSRQETFGLILAESIARGRPVVSTKSGGPEEFINEYNGILVSHSPEEVAEGILQIFEKISSIEPLTLSANCQKKFGGNSVVNKLIQIYNNLKENK